MDPLNFVYVTYIHTTPDKVWNALTSGEFTQQFWFGYRVESDWHVGAPITIYAPRSKGSMEHAADVHGTITAYDPPNFLSYSFDSPLESGSTRERPSKLSFEIKQMGPIVRLTVRHADLAAEDMESDPNRFRGVNNGWPAIMSSLKSLLETGKPISFGPPPAN